MKKAGELRLQADRYRRLKRQISDPAAVLALGELASELEMTAAELENLQHIRDRAHEIWIEHGCPDGRDVEFWLAAEREFEAQRTRGRRRA